MSNLRIVYKNHIDSATLTANPVVESTMPVSYLQNDARGFICRSTGLTSQEIKGEWGGSSITASCLVLWRHNLAATDTIRLQLYSDMTWTTAIYDSTAVNAFSSGLFGDWDMRFSVLWFSLQTGIKSFKLTISSPSNPDGYIEASRLFLGPYTQATYNPNYGLKMGYRSNSTQNRLNSGSLQVTTKAKWRSMEFDMLLTNETDRLLWLEIGRYCGIEKTLFVSVFPGDGNVFLERDHNLLGKFDSESPDQVISGYNQYNYSVKVTEL